MDDRCVNNISALVNEAADRFSVLGPGVGEHSGAPAGQARQLSERAGPTVQRQRDPPDDEWCERTVAAVVARPGTSAAELTAFVGRGCAGRGPRTRSGSWPSCR